MLKHGVAALGASLLLWAGTRSAAAGCPNPCDIDVGPVTVAPLLPSCAHVRAGEDGCECGAFLAVSNGCTESIEATDASFCYPAACRSVEPGSPEALFSWKEGTVGPKQWTLHLRTADSVDHAITVRGAVDSFGGCSCMIAKQNDDGKTPLMLTLAACAIAAALVRRIKRGGL